MKFNQKTKITPQAVANIFVNGTSFGDCSDYFILKGTLTMSDNSTLTQDIDPSLFFSGTGQVLSYNIGEYIETYTFDLSIEALNAQSVQEH